MNSIRRVLFGLTLVASLSSPPALATAFGTDQSDLWYIPAESGWGMQLVQRGQVIFATLFVYGPSGAPTWYTATMRPTATQFQWSGDLYATTGPWFGALPFNSASVTLTKVGTMTWTTRTVDTGSLNYIVNEVAVTKNVVRQTLVFDDYSGTYLGAFHGTATGCSNPANNTPPTDIPSTTISVTQSGQSVSLTISAFGVTLATITGTLSQSGQFGTVLGTYTSSGGEIGDASISEMNVQAKALTASFSLSSTNIGCQTVGYLTGMRSQQ